MSAPLPAGLATRIRHPSYSSRGLRRWGRCEACGSFTVFTPQPCLWPELIAEWQLTPEMVAAMDRRETMHCRRCGNNYRSRQVARALVELYGAKGERSVRALTRSPAFRALRIVAIDLVFLRMLEACPRFSRSDYLTSLIPARAQPDRGLPYPDGSVDLVIAMDTMEHTPRYRRALQEISRVLAPGGRFVTVQPAILSRRSVTRCVADENGRVTHLLPPSRHARGPDDSLVFVEFGIDLLDDIDAAGLQTFVYYYNVPADDFGWVAVCEKPRATPETGDTTDVRSQRRSTSQSMIPPVAMKTRMMAPAATR